MAKYLDDILSGEALRNWQEKEKEQIQAFEVSEEVLEKLKREGRI